MRKIKIIIPLVILTFLYTLPIQGQNNIAEMKIAKYDSLYSAVFEENRKLFIHVPSEYTIGSFRLHPIKYPVIYVLDPEAHFPSIVSMIERLSYEELCPQMIVIGVNVKSEERIKEMFPINDEDKFHQFLENELIPFVDEKYPTFPYRVLFGHSLTGLRTVHTAINHPELFNAYIAIDPSLCHEYCSWYTKYEEQIENFELGKDRMFLAMAHTMGDKDTTEIRKDTSGLATHMNSMMNLSENMLKKNNAKEHYKWKYYPEHSHGGVTLRASLDGLENIFSWFKNVSVDIMISEDSSPEEAFNAYTTHIKKVSEELGFEYLPPEDKVIRMIQFFFYRIQQPEKALPFAEMHLEKYPESMYYEYSKNLLEEIKSALKLKKEK